MDAGGKEMLNSVPDGIHSGLAKAGANGVFFYFQAPAKEGGKLHFWKYFDLRDQSIIDNRYIIANLIACQKDTPRVVDQEMFRRVFDLQEKVVGDILESEEERRALEIAPRSVDPIQQTIATALQSYLNRPDVDRRAAIELIRFLNQPMLSVQVRKLRQIHREIQSTSDIKLLLSALDKLRTSTGGDPATPQPIEKSKQLRREDLRLICFDILTAG